MRHLLTGDPARVRVICVLALAAAALGCAELAALPLPSWPRGGRAGTESLADAGLREALRVGTERAARALSEPGAFAEDAALRLSLPEELATLASVMRRVGLGAQVDALEASMNRAAERAVGEAVPVFAAAIASLSLSDALAILHGERDAATVYFRSRTEHELRSRFEPVVAEAMEAVGLYRAYRGVLERARGLPIATPTAPDLEEIVASRALDALFSRLGEEEGRIREDPAARTNELLRRVFGGRSGLRPRA